MLYLIFIAIAFQMNVIVPFASQNFFRVCDLYLFTNRGLSEIYS